MEAIKIIEDVKMLMVKLTPQQAGNQGLQQNLKSILLEHSGDKTKAKIPVIAIIGHGKQQKFVRFGQNYWVQNESATITSLEKAEFFAYSSSLIPS